MAYIYPMIREPGVGVVETPEFIRCAKRLMTDTERMALIDTLSQNPDGGELIRGTGGARKIRIAGSGRGKSGGYRAIYYYHDEDVPLFLLSVFAKNVKIDLRQGERNELKKVLNQVAENYKQGVARYVKGV